MRLIVGLGNPGARYERTRHNAGFMAVDAIQRHHQFAVWRSKFQGELAEATTKAGEKIYLLKPQTFMNLSGDAVGAASRLYKLAPSQVCVIHDDIDLDPGDLRVKRGGGTAGHNGLRSLDDAIGNDYWRVRIGIGHPGARELVEPYVLHDFGSDEIKWLKPLIDALTEAFPLLVLDDTAGFAAKVASLRPSG
ncbi:MAG TPA: aminoacyl-tRNA hydrolase [Stellaceae bacterium]|nr:aminoacyl-tRNA hydrolase [Stellaceae bacterium]